MSHDVQPVCLCSINFPQAPQDFARQPLPKERMAPQHRRIDRKQRDARRDRRDHEPIDRVNSHRVCNRKET